MATVASSGHGDQVQSLREAVCISHCANTLVKDMNPNSLPPVMGHVNLGMTNDLGEGKL